MTANHYSYPRQVYASHRCLARQTCAAFNRAERIVVLDDYSFLGDDVAHRRHNHTQLFKIRDNMTRTLPLTLTLSPAIGGRGSIICAPLFCVSHLLSRCCAFVARPPQTLTIMYAARAGRLSDWHRETPDAKLAPRFFGGRLGDFSCGSSDSLILFFRLLD